MSLTINGQEYEPIDRSKPSSKHSSRVMSLLAMASVMGSMDGYGNSYSRSLPNNIDIIKEFELIQQKKSRLSKWEREQVVATFNYNYRPIAPTQP